jgi:hypothetical protein
MIGLPLWVKYQERAYLYYVLSTPTQRNLCFEILLEGKNCKIYLNAEGYGLKVINLVLPVLMPH